MARVAQYNTITTAKQAASNLKLDPEALNKALSKMGMIEDILKTMGPDVRNYLQTMSDSLVKLTSREHETEFKTLPAQSSSPMVYAQEWFISRDTSSANAYEGRLPKNFLTPEVVSQAVDTGLLSPEQAKGIEFFFFKSDGSEHADSQGQSGQQGGYQGGGQSGQGGGSSGQQQSSDSNDWQMGLEEVGLGPKKSKIISAPMGKALAGAEIVSGPTSQSSGTSFFDSGNPLGNQWSTSMVQNEMDFVDANFSPDDAAYEALNYMGFTEDMSRHALAWGMSQLQDRSRRKQDLLMQLKNIDPTTPEGAKQMYALQMQMSELGSSESLLRENMAAVQRAKNTLVELLNSLMSTFNKGAESISRNIGRS